MNRLKKVLIIVILFIILLLITGCASLYVTTTMNPGVQPDVKKEMIENEKRILKKQRETDRYHRQQKRELKKANRISSRNYK